MAFCTGLACLMVSDQCTQALRLEPHNVITTSGDGVKIADRGANNPGVSVWTSVELFC